MTFRALHCAVLIVLLAGAAEGDALAAPPAGYYLVWSDEFNGASLDTSKWDNWLLGARRDAINTGSALSFNGSNLVLTTYTVAGTHYTGMISTDGKFLPRYGYLESSIDYNDSPGMWSAFWMQSPWFGMFQGNISDSGAEIDICEHRSTDGSSDISGIVQANIHWDFYGTGAPSTGSGNVGPGTLGNGFHTYGWLWDASNYRLTIDGTQYYSTGSGNSDRTEFIILSSEVQNGSWAGNIPAGGYGDQAGSTTKMVIDYVRWYAPTSQVFWTGASSAYWTNTSPWIASTVRTPGTNDDLVFSTLTDANSSCALGTNFSVRSLTFHDGPGFTINGTNLLVVGAGGIEASPANNNVTINSAVRVDVPQTWKVGPWRTLTVAGPLSTGPVLSGAALITKTGFGTLRLSGTNSYSVTLNVDSQSTSASDGVVCIANSAAIAGVLSPIPIRNNNGGSSTLQLDGSAGSVVVPQNISLNGRNVAVAALENIAGSNALNGGVTINSGGGNYFVQSDAGTLNLGGILSAGSSATGARTITFQGAGNSLVSGSIQNGSAATLNVTKLDAGALTLANANTFNGAMRVWNGTLRLNHSLALQNSALEINFAGGNALRFDAIGSAVLGGLSGLADLWLTNASLAAVALTNGNNNANSEYSGGLKGPGGFTKIGSGTFTLSGTNSYTGATTVASGTLRFGASSNFTALLQPVLWLSFDQAGGGIVTNLGKGGPAMNGTIVGAGAYITNSGRYGNALYVNGAGGSAATNIVLINNSVASLSPSGSWSVSLWIKTTTAGSAFLYQGAGGWASGNTMFYLNSGGTAAGGTRPGAVRYAGGWVTGSTSVNDGNWHFITIQKNSGANSVYLDGVLNSLTANSLNNASAGNQVWIGGAADGSADGQVKMNGLIDEVCIFDRALSQPEIVGLMNNPPGSGKLPAASPVSIAAGATLDLAGVSQQFASLADAGGSGGSIANNSSSPVTLVLSNSAGATTFGGPISDGSSANAISLIKDGASTQILAGANTCRGTITVHAGALLVNGSLGPGSLTVNGGVLGGNGAVGGPATIQSGGTLSPGTSVGTLAFGSELILAAGSTTTMEISTTPLTNDQLLVAGALTFGGTLAVTNLNGTQAAGDSFKLFSAGSYGGAFAGIAPASPGPGLAWNTNTLSTDGTLRVEAAPPAIGSFFTDGENFVLQGINGMPGDGYSVWSTTNVALPLASWELMATGLFDFSGGCVFTNPLVPGEAQRVFLLREP